MRTHLSRERPLFQLIFHLFSFSLLLFYSFPPTISLHPLTPLTFSPLPAFPSLLPSVPFFLPFLWFFPSSSSLSPSLGFLLLLSPSLSKSPFPSVSLSLPFLFIFRNYFPGSHGSLPGFCKLTTSASNYMGLTF